MSWQVLHGDCLDVMAGMEAGSVDAVVTDPPYNVGKQYGSYRDDLPDSEYLSWMRSVYLEASRVTRDSVVFFPGTRHMFDVPLMLRGTGLEVVRCLGWHKKEFAGDLWSGGPAMAWEPVIWASKASKPFWRKVFGTYGRDFLVIPSNRKSGLGHPCPKPLAVMRWLVQLFVPDDGVVLDPFAGTGTTGIAAAEFRADFIGIERESEYVEIARRRIEAAAAQTRLEV